ncbi:MULTISPECIES: alpha/beta hydrolase [unclassified Streptomyces]|uniref:alpha/beta hydrolase n=1 Tax=unclassified Streptomyces TaxID=2593676 RepID=UPI00332A7885
MSSPRTPVVFVPGLWLHSSSWAPWTRFFEDAGYDPIAPGWPGEFATVEETRRRPEALAGHGFDAVVSHYQRLIDSLPTPPILIGHSFGGAVTEKLLGLDRAAAAVAVDAAQIKGVLPVPLTMLRSALPGLRNPANIRRAVSLTREQFRYGFGNAVSPQESDALYEQWSIPGPAKPLFEASVMNFSPRSPLKVDTRNDRRGPLLLITGGKDRTVPPAISKATFKRYEKSGAVTELKEFADRGHSLTVDHGWREIAEFSLKWLQNKGF